MQKDSVTLVRLSVQQDQKTPLLIPQMTRAFTSFICLFLFNFSQEFLRVTIQG